MAFWEDEEDMLRAELDDRQEKGDVQDDLLLMNHNDDEEFDEMEPPLSSQADRYVHARPTGEEFLTTIGDAGDAIASGGVLVLHSHASAQAVVGGVRQRPVGVAGRRGRYIRHIEFTAAALEFDIPAEHIRARLDQILAEYKQAAMDSGSGPLLLPSVRC